MKAERVQKIIAQCGLASRREAEKYIKMGEVTINGKIAQLGDRAVFGKDHIKVSGKLIHAKPEGTKVLVLFKPKGVLPLPNKEGHAPTPSVFDLISRFKMKLIPVGRLDTDTEGVLLFTNNGSLAARLNQDKFEVTKIYDVKIDGHIDEKKLRRVISGVRIEGKKISISKAFITKVTEGKSWIRLETTETQNRNIRKVFEQLAHPIDKLSRDKYADIGTRGLKRGECRFLTENEIKKLLDWVGLKD